MHSLFNEAQMRSRAIVFELLTKQPKELFHYTSGDGLSGILRSGRLRGSNYAFMNDRSEFVYGANLLRNVAEKQFSNQPGDTERRFCESLMSATPTDADLYLVCFCEKGDLLSQWRGYGAQDSRYCICFKLDALRAAHTTGVSPVTRVVYDQDRQLSILERLMELHVGGIHAARTAGMSPSDVLRAATECMFACVLPALAFFKNASFEEECEWRSVLFLNAGEKSKDLDFARSGGVMKPFLPLLQGNDGDLLPIARVVAGASRSELQAIKSARLMLRKFGYADVPVEASHVPLAG